MGAWFLGNQISNTLVSTGAFEIYVNDNLEYSKLNLGVMPSQQVLDKILIKYKIIPSQQ
jgi:hypothetical protein